MHQVAPCPSQLWAVLAWKVASIKWPQAWHMWQLAAAGLSPQHGSSQVPPSTAHVATHLKSLCSSNQVALSWAHMAANIGLHQSPFQEAAESTHLVACFIPHQRATQPAPQRTHLRSRLLWHQSSTKVIPTLWGQGPHNSLCTRPAFTASQPKDQSHPLTCLEA